jgi:hypothetical protein
MGYDTNFTGEFLLNKPLSPVHRELLEEYLEEHDGCQWVLDESGTGFEWDGNEKFYNYDQELRDLIARILEPHSYLLNGVVFWCGDDPRDIGTLYVKDNILKILPGLACSCEQIVSTVTTLCQGCPELSEGCWEE